MAHQTTINVNGQSIPVTEFDHTAQEIDDSVEKTVTMVRPNLLDNWYFAGGGSQQGGGQFPINQRGSANYSGSSMYSVDRWKFIGRVAMTLDSDSLSITSNVTSGGSNLRQLLNCDDLDGLTLTVSILSKSVSRSGACGGVVRNSQGSTIKWTPYASGKGIIQTTMKIPQNSGRLSFEFNVPGGETWEVIAAKLEIGEGQTLAHQDEDGNWVLNEIPNFQEQLARCQRYAISLNPYKYGSRTVGSGISTSATSCYVFCPTPVPVRTTPSITRSGSWRLVGSNTCTVSNITVNNFAGNGVKLLATSSGLIDGETYFLESSANSSDILLSADL